MKILKCLLMIVTAPGHFGVDAFCLAAGQGAEFESCDPGLGVWVNDVNIIWNEKKQDNGR